MSRTFWQCTRFHHNYFKYYTHQHLKRYKKMRHANTAAGMRMRTSALNKGVEIKMGKLNPVLA